MSSGRKKSRKQDHDLGKIEEYKARFSRMSTEQVRERLNQEPLIHEARIALRRILEERKVVDP